LSCLGLSVGKSLLLVSLDLLSDALTGCISKALTISTKDVSPPLPGICTSREVSVFLSSIEDC